MLPNTSHFLYLLFNRMMENLVMRDILLFQSYILALKLKFYNNLIVEYKLHMLHQQCGQISRSRGVYFQKFTIFMVYLFRVTELTISIEFLYPKSINVVVAKMNRNIIHR